MATQVRGSTQLKEWADIILSQNTTDSHTRMKTGYNSTISDPLDIVTKGYVDGVATGLDVKESVRISSYADSNWTSSVSIAFSSPTLTISNLSTGTSLGLLDGVEPVNGDRVLIKNAGAAGGSGGAESDVYNGIWVITGGTTTSLTMTRATDLDEDSELNAGVFTFVEEGTQNADTGWVVSSDNPLVVNTDANVWTKFSSAGDIVAGDGLTKSGTTLSVNVDDSTIEIVTDTLQLKDGGILETKLSATNAATDGYVLTYDNGTGGFTWVDPATITPDTTLTTEEVEDIAGGMFVDSSTIDFTYDDGAGTITGIVIDASITTGKLETLSEGEVFVGESTGNVKAKYYEFIDGGSGITGVIDNSNTTFTLEDASNYYHPIDENWIQVYLNGVLQRGGGVDYTLTINSGSTASQIVLASAPKPSPGNPDLITVTTLATSVGK